MIQKRKDEIKDNKKHIKRFFFEQKWLMEENFSDTIKSLRNQTPADKMLHIKMDNLALHLMKWANENMGTIPKNIKKARKNLNRLLNSESNEYRAQEITSLENKLEKLLNQEEIHWKQRSRNQWLKGGDRNTAYIHKMASERRRRNTISSLQIDKYGWTDIPSQIEDSIISYYEDLFNSSNPTIVEIEHVTNTVELMVKDNMNEDLKQPFTKEKVLKALLDLNPNKAPSPDGFRPCSSRKNGNKYRLMC